MHPLLVLIYLSVGVKVYIPHDTGLVTGCILSNAFDCESQT